ncbi:zinc ribbon domain-containing protein [Methanobrevibacter sp. DSM 116169]|uniref:zinc ribbon domain-containing protein n=1 Tax=Methanobrevibacter sp. DSM 116169 TaxID=3242727 RepID=UPI0038FCAEF0
MVKCPRCSYENNDDESYCSNCKYPLNINKKFSENERKSRWSNFSMGKKVILVIAIVALLILTFNLIYTSTEADKPSSEIITTNESPVIKSSNPYQVRVIYNGSWSGDVGIADLPISRSGYGNELIFIDGAPWDNVNAVVYKNDASDKNLTIQLLQDGKVIKENSTTKPNGAVRLSL